jgi:hypothetical protein
MAAPSRPGLMAQPELTAVVPTYNGRQLLEAMLPLRKRRVGLGSRQVTPRELEARIAARRGV